MVSLLLTWGGFMVVGWSFIVFDYPEFNDSQVQLKNHSNNLGMVIE
jgi:hypothetical protein